MKNENQTVGLLSELLAQKCGYSHNEAKRIKVAGALHDIGKIRISDALLLKPGKLTPEEFEIIKLHTKYGEQILGSMQGTLGKMARQIALLHHERFDKNGYWHYKTSDIPKYISIVSICDVAVALRSKRSYKPP